MIHRSGDCQVTNGGVSMVSGNLLSFSCMNLVTDSRRAADNQRVFESEKEGEKEAWPFDFSLFVPFCFIQRPDNREFCDHGRHNLNLEVVGQVKISDANIFGGLMTIT